LRLQYIVFRRIAGCRLLTRTRAAKDVEILVLRPENAVVLRLNPAHSLEWADRAEAVGVGKEVGTLVVGDQRADPRQRNRIEG
jgi:hypothetical protein